MQKYLTLKFVIPAVLFALVGLAVVWWLASPLFINQMVNEAAPLASAQISQAPTAAPVQPVTSNDAMPAAPPQIVRTGNFYNVVHDGSGTAQILRLEDGSHVLRFDTFQVLNGPDLYVYLTSADKIDSGIGGELPNVLNLGKLKGNQGAQNYVLPAGIELSQYNSVVIWCQAFRVPFAAAPLS